MTRGPRALAGVALAVAILVLAGCSDPEEAGPGSPRPPTSAGSGADVPTTVDHPAYGAIADALRGPGGLVVCSQRSEAGDASGSYERRVLTVAVGSCPPDSGGAAASGVAVDAYDATAIRDASAAVDFGGRRTAWTYLQFVVSLADNGPPEVAGGVEAAMTALGAEKTYERPAGAPG